MASPKACGATLSWWPPKPQATRRPRARSNLRKDEHGDGIDVLGVELRVGQERRVVSVGEGVGEPAVPCGAVFKGLE